MKELIQGLGRALAVLREHGASQESLQRIEDDITALDAVHSRDVAAGEAWAARMVGRLYGLDTSQLPAREPEGSFSLAEAKHLHDSPDASPAAAEPPAAAEVPAEVPPVRAPKQEWADHAVAAGVAAPEEVADMTKAEIVEQVREAAPAAPDAEAGHVAP